MLHGVFGFVFKALHYDQGQLEMLRKVSTECNKVSAVLCVVGITVLVCSL